MRKSIFLCAAAIFFAATALSAQVSNLEDVVNKKYLDELKSVGMVQVVHPKDDNALSLVPLSFYRDRIEKETVKKDEKGVPFVAEVLYLIPKADLLKNAADKNRAITTDDVSVILRSISKMTGMRYHVGEKGPKDKGEVLYKKTYMIATPDSNEAIADKNTGSADGQVSYCYQHDHTYGDIKYKLEYYQKENQLYVTFLNIIPVTMLGVKMIMPSNIRINAISIDCGESILFYLSTDCNAKKINIINVRKQLEESLVARIDALYQWFLQQF